MENIRNLCALPGEARFIDSNKHAFDQDADANNNRAGAIIILGLDSLAAALDSIE